MNRLASALLFTLFGALISLSAKPGETVVVLVGDSTVTDARPDRDEAGWGWAMEQMAKPGVVVHNTAKGGRSSLSFRTEGLWDKAMALEPDWVVIQFGHNDQPGKGPERESDPKTSYRDHLREYIKEVRAQGGQVVLVTPVARRTFYKDGTLMDSLEPYALATIAVAKETNVPVIDLHGHSMQEYLALGWEGSNVLGRPDAIRDRTHFSKAGSRIVAIWVHDLMTEQAAELAALFDPNLMPELQSSGGSPSPSKEQGQAGVSGRFHDHKSARTDDGQPASSQGVSPPGA